jgi:hypothetical protein
MHEMKLAQCVSACALLVMVAGSAMAQPAVNGQLKPEYGPIQWSNSTGTGFGNAGIATAPACDPIGGGLKLALNNSSRAGIAAGTGAADQAAAALVTTGYELKIPLESLGLDITNGGANLPDPVVVRVAGWVGSGDYGGVSNQFIGGLGGISATTPPNNYPNPRTIDFTSVPNNQYVEISIPKATLLALANGSEPTLDGTADASYGPALFVQDTQTNYGDAATAQSGADTIFRCQGGSEIDGVFGRFGRDAVGDPALYLVLAGNFESNYNKVSLFFDSIAGGQNQLTGDSATQTGIYGSIFGGGANAYGATTGAGALPGLKFDAGFTADFFLGFSVGGGGDASPTIFADWQRLRTSPTDAGSARFIGGTNATTNGGILTASDPCPPFVEPNYADVANGSEIDGLYATVCGQYLYVLVTGNLQNNGNRLDLFFDVGSVSVPLSSTGAGQNRLLGNSHPFDFGHLNRLGQDSAAPTTSPGLRFSAGFDADYWVSFENTGSTPSVTMTTYAGLVNAGGALNDGGFPNAAYLEYGSFAGGAKATNNPLVFDGQKCVRLDMTNACAPNGAGTAFNPTSIPGIDIQGDATANGLPLVTEPYASYAPRLISQDVFNPFGISDGVHPNANHGSYAVPGLISTSIDNSNWGGVTDVDASQSKQVGTGMEVKIRLDELGYSGSGPIRVAGFIVSNDHSFVSNQVIGGTLPATQANLGEPRTLDFQAAPFDTAGPFYVTIDPGTCTTVAAGACCFGTTGCVLMSSAQCTAASGTYSGDSTVCNPSPCGGATTGVCCRGATCSIVLSTACTVASGAAGAHFVAGNACNSGSTTTPCCYADFNKVGGISVNDIFDFLNDWFAGSPYANTGGNGAPGPLNVQNIFDFLNDWFSGGC